MRLQQIYLGFVVGLAIGVILGLIISTIAYPTCQDQSVGNEESRWPSHPGQDFLPPLNEYEPPPHKFILPERPTPPPLENEVHA